MEEGQKQKWRLIHDLAYPYDRDQSVNSCIPDEHCMVQYHYIDEVIELALALGEGIWGARIDILFAFRNQTMLETELPILAFTLNGKIYINACLPFGAGSSCFIFETVAGALQWVITNETGCSWLSHFLDDFPLLPKTCFSLQKFVNSFYRIMEDIGMPIAIEKTLGPTQILEYLRLILDFVNQLMGIPEKKRKKCLDLVSKLISTHTNGAKTMVKMIQKMVGSLNFICQAIPAGKLFLASLYRLTHMRDSDQHKMGHHRCNNKETCDDLKIFESFLQVDPDQKMRTVPFLNKL